MIQLTEAATVVAMCGSVHGLLVLCSHLENGSGNDSSAITCSATLHGMSFTCACLAIAEQAHLHSNNKMRGAISMCGQNQAFLNDE